MRWAEFEAPKAKEEVVKQEPSFLTDWQLKGVELAYSWDKDKPLDIAYRGNYIMLVPDFTKAVTVWHLFVWKAESVIFKGSRSSYSSAVLLAQEVIDNDLCSPRLRMVA